MSAPNWLGNGAAPKAYAEVYESGASVVQSLPNGTTFTKITPFAHNGLSHNATPDYANHRIVITKSGKYRVSFYFSSSIATNNTILDTVLFVDGTISDNIHSSRATKAGDISISSCTGLIALTDGQVIDVRCRHDYQSAVNITIINSSLSVQYIDHL